MDLHRATDHRSHFRPHEYLAREGRLPDAIFRIDEGCACRFRLLSDGRRQITALFLPGELCEPQWAIGAPLFQPVIALTALRATKLPCSSNGAHRPEQMHAILTSLGEAIERQAKWLVMLGRGTALQRVASLICDFYERMDRAGLTYNQQCAMPLTQTDMADLTGLTSVHVNRTLQALRGMNLIELGSRWLRIPDQAALKAVALRT